MITRTKLKSKSAVPIEGGRFVPLTFEELDSVAYISLAGNSAKVYCYLKRAARTAAYKNSTHERDIQFDFTYSEAKRCGFSESTFIRAIKELWSKGFIDIVERGGLRGHGRTNSRYKITNLWKSYGKHWTDRTDHQMDPFKDTTEPKSGNKKW